MRLFYTQRFEKLYRKLQQPVKKKLNRQLSLLAQDLRHPSLRAKKMTGQPDIWEAYIDIHHRFTFKMENNRTILRAVGPHDILKKP